MIGGVALLGVGQYLTWLRCVGLEVHHSWLGAEPLSSVVLFHTPSLSSGVRVGQLDGLWLFGTLVVQYTSIPPFVLCLRGCLVWFVCSCRAFILYSGLLFEIL